MDWGTKVTYLGATTLKEKTVSFGMYDEDRTRHFSVLGRVGSGRGDLLVSMALQDIERGVSTVFLDATGESVTKLIERIDPAHLDRIIFIDPSDAEYPYSWNIVDDIKKLPVAEQVVFLVHVLSDLFALSKNEFLEKSASLLLDKKDTTILTFYSLIVDEKFRETFFENEEKQKEYEAALLNETAVSEALHEHGKYLAKDTLVRNVIGQKKSKFSFHNLAQDKIVVVDFSRIRLFPTRMTPIVRLFLHGIRLTEHKNVPKALYIHDCIRYVQREYLDALFVPEENMAITIADTVVQEQDQEHRMYALSRCASVASFATHPADKELIERAFYPFVDPEEMLRLEPKEFVVMLTIQGVRTKPFFAKALPLPDKKHVSYQDILVQARRDYATLRTDVDAELKGTVKDDNKKPPNINSPKGFQDAFKSIFAKQAEKAQQVAAQPTSTSNAKPDTSPKNTEKSEEKKEPPSKKEVPETLLKQMLHVAPVSMLLMFIPMVASANMMITEIMYDAPGTDTGHEWVEVQNTGSETVAFDEWKFFESNTNHSLTLVSGGGVPPGGYAIIADNPTKFLADWPSFSGVLYDSTFSLSNSGELLTIRDPSLVDVDAVMYDTALGGAGDGNTLQQHGGVWTAGVPTPGAPFLAPTSSQTTPPPTSSNTQETTSTGAASGGGAPLPRNIFVDGGADRTVFVGADGVFTAHAIGLNGEPLENARFIWTFGNGDRREGQSVLYHFVYPGHYVVIVDVSNGLYSTSDRIEVDAIPAQVAVTEVTKEYIALKNNGSTEIDLGGWYLFSAGTQFQFPMNTVLLKGQEVLVSNERTGLSGAAPNTVALQYPNGLVADSFAKPLFVERPVSVGLITPVLTKGRTQLGGTVNSASSIGAAVLAANDTSEDTSLLITAPVVAVSEATPQVPSFLGWLIALFALVGIAGAGVVFLRGNGYHEYSINEIQ